MTPPTDRPVTKRQQQERRESMRPHPMRDQIVDVMRVYGKPISPTQLSRVTGGTLGSTAYHVRTLVAAGIVQLVEEGRVRGAVEHFYALANDTEHHTLTLVDPVHQVLALAGALTIESGAEGQDDLPMPTAGVLDNKARTDLLRIVARTRDEVHSVVAKAAKRARPKRTG